MLNATMKPLLSNKSYIHIRKPGFPVKMRDIFYYFLTILKAHSSFRFPQYQSLGVFCFLLVDSIILVVFIVRQETLKYPYPQNI